MICGEREGNISINEFYDKMVYQIRKFNFAEWKIPFGDHDQMISWYLYYLLKFHEKWLIFSHAGQFRKIEIASDYFEDLYDFSEPRTKSEIEKQVKEYWIQKIASASRYEK